VLVAVTINSDSVDGSVDGFETNPESREISLDVAELSLDVAELSLEVAELTRGSEDDELLEFERKSSSLVLSSSWSRMERRETQINSWRSLTPRLILDPLNALPLALVKRINEKVSHEN